MSPVEKPRAPARIIAALNRREQALFLEPVFADSGLGEQIVFAGEPDLSPDRWLRQLESWRPEILITAWSTPPLPAAWLEHPDCSLRYVCHVVGSVRHLVPRSFIERGGLVTNWGERISAQVAEHGLLLALAALRNQAAWSGFISRRPEDRQITDLRTRTLFGLRVGLHGFGSVARSLLALLRPFGVTVTAYSAGVPDAVFAEHGVKPAASLEQLFAGSDVLFECESLTPSNQGAVTAAVLAALPDDAVFVNIGRGGLVDEAALIREGRAGRLRIALDVVAVEPLTPASPFLHVPGLVLSPHIGGPTFDRYVDCGAHALANVKRVLSGDRPTGVISLSVYDRAT